MAHEVESMAYVGDVPWHGLGIPITDPDAMRDPERFLIAAGLDWEVEKVPTITEDTYQPTGYYTIRRMSDGAILGNVGKVFHPLQNRKAFEWFAPFFKDGYAKFEAGGSLRNGAIIWGLAKIEGVEQMIRKDDPVSSYILLSHGHDGFHMVRAGFTPVRVVCMNTLRAAEDAAGSQLIRMKHTAKLETNLEALSNVMDVALQEFLATAEQFKLLADKGINQEDVQKYVKLVLDVYKENEEEEKISPQTQKKIDRIVDLAFNGRGNLGKTYWDAYNGITEYLNWEAGRGEDSRIQSLWFGSNGSLSQDALRIGIELAQAA